MLSLRQAVCSGSAVDFSIRIFQGMLRDGTETSFIQYATHNMYMHMHMHIHSVFPIERETKKGTIYHHTHTNTNTHTHTREGRITA